MAKNKQIDIENLSNEAKETKKALEILYEKLKQDYTELGEVMKRVGDLSVRTFEILDFIERFAKEK